jgi:hypothetical protein
LSELTYYKGKIAHYKSSGKITVDIEQKVEVTPHTPVLAAVICISCLSKHINKCSPFFLQKIDSRVRMSTNQTQRGKVIFKTWNGGKQLTQIEIKDSSHIVKSNA